jgi:hypothetical protein
MKEATEEFGKAIEFFNKRDLKTRMTQLLKEHGYKKPGKLLIHLGENGGVKRIEDTIYR